MPSLFVKTMLSLVLLALVYISPLSIEELDVLRTDPLPNDDQARKYVPGAGKYLCVLHKLPS